jgi:hypothetical protein
MLAVFVFVFALLGGATHVAMADTPQGSVPSVQADDEDKGKDEEKKEEPKKRMKRRDYSNRLANKVKKPGPPPKKPKYKPWNKVVTKDHQKQEGLLPLYIKQEEVLLELSDELLNKPMLAVMHLSQGIGSHFLFGGLPVDNVMFDFHRQEDHIQVRRLSTQFRANGDEALEKSLDLTFTESILASLPIKTEKKGKIVVDIKKLFLSDVSGMSMWLGAVFQQPVRLDGKKGYFESIKNYPENTEVDTRLTYMPGRAQTLNLPNVPDPRYVQVGVQWSIHKLPEEPMMPRIADDRIGYFTTTHKDFTKVGNESFFVHYSNRWRLEKKDSSAAVSEPVEPIVYYMDHTIPEDYVQYIMEGVELWQRAFEKAGFKNAIIAKRAPTPEEDPEFDPEDARYNTIRWSTSDQVMYGAIGPSQVDPRTGEIINADILFEHSMVATFGKVWRRFAGPEAALMSVDPGLKEFWMTDEELAAEISFDNIPQLRDKGHMMCALQDWIRFGGHMQWMALVANGTIEAGEEMPMEYIGEALRFVSAHEVGHTLGLRHNFKSSGSTPYGDLHDKDIVEEIGMTGSVMDYSAPNISRDPDAQGYYYAPSVGTYDDWAITYGYKQVEGENEWEQYANLQDITEQSTEKRHLYGTDEDTYPRAALDPRCNIWDLSDDVFTWSDERIAICDDLLLTGRLEDRVVKDGDNYLGLTNGVVTLLIQKYIACNMVVKNIGGSYAERAHKGSGVTPIHPVSAAQQQKAFDFIVKHGLDSDRFMLTPDLVNKLQDDKMWSWQNNPFRRARFDFPLANWVATIHNALLTNLMNPTLQARVVENEYKSERPFRLADLYNGLTRTIWTDNVTPSGQAAGLDRNLQRLYTYRLIAQVTTPYPGTPTDAIDLSRLHLRRVRNAANSALQRSGLDDATNAHLMETIARIDRALDAQRVTGF